MSRFFDRASTTTPGGPVDPGELFGREQLLALGRVARALAPTGVDPDDLLQDAIERVLRKPDRFQPGTNFHAWMRTMIRRLAIDGARAHRRFRDLAHSFGAAAEQQTPWPVALLADVRRAVEKFPAPLATTYRLFVFEGLSYTQIAARLCIPLRTVGTRLTRARNRLRLLLQRPTRRDSSRSAQA